MPLFFYLPYYLIYIYIFFLSFVFRFFYHLFPIQVLISDTIVHFFRIFLIPSRVGIFKIVLINYFLNFYIVIFKVFIEIII